jgi:hypothetical protein
MRHRFYCPDCHTFGPWRDLVSDALRDMRGHDQDDHHPYI